MDRKVYEVRLNLNGGESIQANQLGMVELACDMNSTSIETIDFLNRCGQVVKSINTQDRIYPNIHQKCGVIQNAVRVNKIGQEIF